MKDAEPPPPFSFSLRSVELGIDEDGDPVTSCVIEAAATAPQQATGPKLNDGQALCLRALRDVVADSGLWQPADLPDYLARPGISFPVATLTAWRDRAAAMAGADMKPDTFERTFRRYRDRLQKLNLVHVWESVAWPV